MDWPASEADVRAAYRIFLRRDADDVGLVHYTARGQAGELTVAQLARELMKSPEYYNGLSVRTAVVDLGGIFVVVDPTEREFGRHIAADRTWEPHIVNQVVRRLSPGATFVDVGANVGIMSFHAANVVGESGRVVAFEPNQENVQLFLRGMVINGFKNVVLYPFAASNGSSVFSLQGGSNTHLETSEASGSLTQSFAADEFLHSLERVDLIKIDIEGHEPQALSGLKDTIRRHRPYILCEFNPRCLKDHIGQNKVEFAHSLFATFSRVTAIEHDGRETATQDAKGLLSLWEIRNKEAVASGFLPDGMLHFDLILGFD